MRVAYGCRADVAKAPGHRLGQIVGDVLEETIRPILQVFADHHELYLDLKGQRPARPGKKVTWVDDLGNAHDLDFVLERGGDNYTIGLPASATRSRRRHEVVLAANPMFMRGT